MSCLYVIITWNGYQRSVLLILCRFGYVEEKTNNNRLYVILNPTNSKHKSYIQHWTGPNYTLTKVAQAGEPLSALAVSRCGRYIAVGSMTTGDVDIYIAFSLQVNTEYKLQTI